MAAGGIAQAIDDIQKMAGSSAYNYSYAYTAHKDLD